jgi:hypothetical protein
MVPHDLQEGLVPNRVSATVDSYTLPVAATMLGVRGASRAGIVRSALALFHGRDRAEAARFANSDAKLHDAESGREHIRATIPDDLPVPENQAWAVRVGLGMAMGLSRTQAEKWAKIDQGRPRKQEATT